MFGLAHGQKVASSQLEIYEKVLCGDANEYWNQCIDLSTNHIKGEQLPEIINGRVMVKYGSLFGVLTKNGPVTMTLSGTHYHSTAVNICYKKKCGEQKNSKSKK